MTAEFTFNGLMDSCHGTPQEPSYWQKYAGVWYSPNINHHNARIRLDGYTYQWEIVQFVGDLPPFKVKAVDTGTCRTLQTAKRQARKRLELIAVGE